MEKAMLIARNTGLAPIEVTASFGPQTAQIYLLTGQDHHFATAQYLILRPAEGEPARLELRLSAHPKIELYLLTPALTRRLAAATPARPRRIRLGADDRLLAVPIGLLPSA